MCDLLHCTRGRERRVGSILLLSFSFVVLGSGAGFSAGRAFDCLLEPRLKIKLATPVAGVLKDVPVDRGSIIRKGDLLAQLESSVERAQLDLAEARAESDAAVKSREARVSFLTKKHERTRALSEKSIATTAALEEVESDFAVAGQELREAQSNLKIAGLDVARAAEVLKQRAIRSPIDGVVAERSLVGGEYAYEQAPIMTIAQVDPLNVEVFVPIALYDVVKIGMKAVVSGEQPVGGRYIATVELIDPVLHSGSGTFGIRLLLPNPNNKIPAGLRCKVEFPVDSALLAKATPETTALKDATPTAFQSSDLAEQFQIMTRDLTALRETIEQLKVKQDQSNRDNENVEVLLKASQEQMARNIGLIEQIKASQAQLAREGGKSADQLKAGQGQPTDVIANASQPLPNELNGSTEPPKVMPEVPLPRRRQSAKLAQPQKPARLQAKKPQPSPAPLTLVR